MTWNQWALRSNAPILQKTAKITIVRHPAKLSYILAYTNKHFLILCICNIFFSFSKINFISIFSIFVSTLLCNFYSIFDQELYVIQNYKTLFRSKWKHALTILCYDIFIYIWLFGIYIWYIYLVYILAIYIWLFEKKCILTI